MSLLQKPRRRRIAFMLTPLVDVMFLLLIFFMLSSQTAPYSLLTIFAPRQGTAATPPAQQPQTPAAPKREVLVSVNDGFVRFNGQRVELADLRAAIADYKAQGYANATILTSRAAHVQDVVSVLEAFDSAAFGATRLMLAPGQ
jgi:biopolymer transport protein ExbD